jgi:high-affinity nickel permease
VSLVSGLDKGLVIGSLIAEGILFILAMMSVVIFLAVASLFEAEASDACDK